MKNQNATFLGDWYRRGFREALVLAAVLVQDRDGHDPDCPWYYGDDGHVAGCTCEAHEMAEKILAIQPYEATREC